MKFITLSICLVFASQTQASLLSKMFYKSWFSGSSSVTPLNTGLDAVEGINDEQLHVPKSTTEAEPKEESEQVHESVDALLANAKDDSFTSLALKVLKREPATPTLLQKRQPYFVSMRFKELMEQENYAEIEKFGKTMPHEQYLKYICPLITTLEHHRRLIKESNLPNMAPDFFLYGDMGVIKGVISGIREYDTKSHIEGGDLETALFLAFKDGHHGRFIELLVAKHARMTEQGRVFDRPAFLASCERIIDWLSDQINPLKYSMPLKRFLTFWGEEFNAKHPDVYEIFCEGLVHRLSFKSMVNRHVKKLLVDLIGQPSLLPPAAFAKGFLYNGGEVYQHNFMVYCWEEAVKEAVKPGCSAGRALWRMLTGYRLPPSPLEAYPPSAEALAIVLAREKVPTKQELEERWARENASQFLEKRESLAPFFDTILPKDLSNIVLGYAPLRPTWLDIGKA